MILNAVPIVTFLIPVQTLDVQKSKVLTERMMEFNQVGTMNGYRTN